MEIVHSLHWWWCEWMEAFGWEKKVKITLRSWSNICCEKTVVFCESNGWQKVNGKWINPNQNKQTNHYWSIKSMTIIINFILLPMNELVGQNDNNYVAWPEQQDKMEKIKQCRCSIILIKLSHHAQHIHFSVKSL